MKFFQLTNKVAAITGGGSGIGEGIARVFAEAGAIVHIIDINKEEGKNVAQSIRSSGGQAYGHKGDVSRQKEMIEVVDRIVDQSGSLDIMVNNAGVANVGKLDTTTEEDFDFIYQVNVKGVYNSMLAAIKHMKKQNRGVILNMASVASVLGLPDRFAYSMSKGAVLNMTYTVARDYVDFNIRCNSISPARIHTPFVDGFLAKNYPGKEKEMYDTLAKTQPIGRMGTPVEVGHLALYLCSDEAGFITGTDFPIDGGFIRLNT